jgi:hypothetical protein
METLNNYITERIRIDNIKHLEFPIDGTIDDMVEFLQSQGFSRMYPNTFALRSKFNEVNNKCFVAKVNKAIWFADTSNDEINGDNPIFSVDEETSNYRSYYIWGYDNIDEVSKKTFLEAINKQFDF